MLQVDPLSELLHHCGLGVGEPLAVAVKLAVVPAKTVVLDGCVVTEGIEVTVSVAASVVAEPKSLVNTAWY